MGSVPTAESLIAAQRSLAILVCVVATRVPARAKGPGHVVALNHLAVAAVVEEVVDVARKRIDRIVSRLALTPAFLAETPEEESNENKEEETESQTQA